LFLPCRQTSTLVLEVFLDFSLRKREPRSGGKENLVFFLAASRFAFAALRLSHAGKNQGREKNQSIIQFLITGID